MESPRAIITTTDESTNDNPQCGEKKHILWAMIVEKAKFRFTILVLLPPSSEHYVSDEITQISGRAGVQWCLYGFA